MPYSFSILAPCLMGSEDATIGSHHKVFRHTAEHPLAQTTVAECSRDDQINLKVPSDFSQLDGLSAVRNRCATLRFDAVPGKPVAHVVETAPGRVHGFGIDDFHHVDAFAGLQQWQGVGDRSPCLALVVPADEGVRQFEAGGAGGNEENRTTDAHYEIADFHLPEGKENSIARLERGDDEIGAARFISEIFIGRRSDHLYAPLKIFHLRQGGVKLCFGRGGILQKFVEIVSEIVSVRLSQNRAVGDGVAASP